MQCCRNRDTPQRGRKLSKKLSPSNSICRNRDTPQSGRKLASLSSSILFIPQKQRYPAEGTKTFVFPLLSLRACVEIEIPRRGDENLALAASSISSYRRNRDTPQRGRTPGFVYHYVSAHFRRNRDTPQRGRKRDVLNVLY